jgi:hypothetical protein
VLELVDPSNISRDIPGKYKSVFNTGLPGRSPIFVHERYVSVIIIRSRSPKADEFREWVMDVIESIRKKGEYREPQVRHSHEVLRDMDRKAFRPMTDQFKAAGCRKPDYPRILGNHKTIMGTAGRSRDEYSDFELIADIQYSANMVSSLIAETEKNVALVEYLSSRESRRSRLTLDHFNSTRVQVVEQGIAVNRQR